MHTENEFWLLASQKVGGNWLYIVNCQPLFRTVVWYPPFRPKNHQFWGMGGGGGGNRLVSYPLYKKNNSARCTQRMKSWHIPRVVVAPSGPHPAPSGTFLKVQFYFFERLRLLSTYVLLRKCAHSRL